MVSTIAQRQLQAQEQGGPASLPNMFSFEPKQPTVSKTLTKEEVKQALANVPDKKAGLQKLIQAGYELEGFAPAQIETPAPAQVQESSTASSIGDFFAGLSQAPYQAVGGLLEVAGDVVSAPFSENVSYGGIFTGGNKGGLGQFARDTKESLLKGSKQAFNVQNEGAYKGGLTTGAIASSIVTPGGVLGKAKDVGTFGKIGLGAVQGAIETGKYNVLSEGRIGTPTELGTGALLGGGLAGAGAGLSAGKKYLTEKLPLGMIGTGISTPSKLLNASERLNKLGDPAFQDANSASKWLLKNKVAGDLDTRVGQLNSLAKSAREKAQNLLKGSKITVSDDIAGEMKKGLEALRPKLETAGLTKYTSFVDDFLAKDKITAEELNKARTFIADKGGIFKQSGDWVDSLQKEALQDIWKNSSKYLDEAIPGFRASNKDYEVASALAESIGLKIAQDQARQVFSLVNVAGAGIGGTIGAMTADDPMNMLKNAAIGAAVGASGRAIFSPANMSKLALKLNEYATKAEARGATKAIEAFIQSRGATIIPQKYIDIIKKATTKAPKNISNPKVPKGTTEVKKAKKLKPDYVQK